MPVKKGLGISLFAMLFLSMAMVAVPARAPPADSIYVTPSYVEGHYVGETFSLEVRVNITWAYGLYGFEYILKWNSTLLKCTKITINPLRSWYFIAKNERGVYANGTAYHWLEVTWKPSQPVWGDTALCTYDFQVAHQPYFPEPDGTSPLDLQNVGLADPEAVAIPHTTRDGQYEIRSIDRPVYVDPSRKEAVVAETFAINISVINVEDFYGFELKLYWKTTVLHCVGAIITPPWTFYSVAKNETMENFNATHGRYWVAVTALAPSPSFNGNTILVKLYFKAMAVGDSVLDLMDTKLATTVCVPLSHSTIDGYVIVEKGILILGDVNADGIVDILDVVIWANAFGSRPGDPKWNPIVDLKPDNLIDIFDAIIIGVDFGKTA